ncbi:MAG: bifunctional alpha,alpha-trehalose-phosphate synthase (UDP-forming)/trehalose-phosphatase [Lentisphaeria bacterium]
MFHVVNVTYRLPVTVEGKKERASEGLLATIAHAEKHYAVKWVGWPGKILHDVGKQRDVSAKLKGAHKYTPVFLTQAELDGFYYGFSNASAWPVLHYMAQYMHYESSWWDAYCAVNRKFAEIVCGTLEEGDVVWVHDYQLMLLPSMIRQRRPDVRVAFFLHTPFPSYEIFRSLPHREDLIKGILGADQIGFHTFGYLRHFRSTVLRLLGYATEMDHVLHEGRRTYIGVYPIGIDAPRFAEELATKRHARHKMDLRKMYENKTLVLSVERIDYSKGIERRLEAIETFLRHWHPKDDIVFLFINIPSRTRVNEYKLLRQRLESRIGHINSRYGTLENVPVHCVFHAIPFPELCALYAVADAALVTPLIDGMNLVAKEYVAAKQDECGVLLLSEFAGAAEELWNAVLVNPFNVAGMAEKIKEALALSETEKHARMQKMRKRVMTYDAHYWAGSFIEDLRNRPVRPRAEVRREQQISEILAAFKGAGKVGCFLDYDGTLREFEQDPTHALPMPEICDLLCELADNPRIDPYLISGRKRHEMQEWFGDLEVTLIAEHGLAVRPAGEGDWRAFYKEVDLSWKEIILGMLHHYEGITPGSHVEEKQASVAWHYRAADPEFGDWKARQLVAALDDMLTGIPAEVHHGQSVVEVVSVYVNKGAAVERMLLANSYDLVVCAGDDITDESMLRKTDAGRFGIKIGAGETEARYQIQSPSDLRSLLEEVLEVLE